MQNLPKHILVIRLSAMGDVAMSIPVLRAFTQQNPDVKLTILTREFFKPFFRDLPNVSVFATDVKGRHKGIFGLYRLSKELKKLNIDAVSDLHNVLRSNILKFFLSSSPFFQIDKGRAQKNALVSGDNFKQLKTTHKRYVEVFEKLGFKIDLTKTTFPEAKLLNEKTLKITESKNSKWIGIAPFAAYKSKMYPLDKMVDVIDALSKDYKIFLFGGGDKEILFLQPLADTYKNVINLAGKLTLEQELDVISNLDVMLSMDSGNGHLAAMFGKKVITVWGVTHPFAGFTPFNQPENHQLLSDREKFPKIPTSIYGNKFPEEYEQAAGSILPEEIVSKIKEEI